LGITDLFLHELAAMVIEASGHEYEEISEKQDYIKKIIRLEEERFAATIDQGLELLNAHVRELKEAEERILSGDKVFFLYDTLGVNPELTKEVLAEHGIEIDEEGFQTELRRQQENSRRGMKTADDTAWKKSEEIFIGLPPTDFVGYDELQKKVTVNLIVIGGHSTETAEEGAEARIVLDRTPFYAEGGGQAADSGKLTGDEVIASVIGVSKSGNVYIHKVVIRSGALRVGAKLTAVVDSTTRNRTARNHTATHLLHKVLSNILGNHVKQAGSSVDADSLRFDFTHYEALEPSVLSEVETMVNQVIDAFMPVTTTVTTVESAREHGATALFDEKYGDKVRLVAVGDFSAELCGGTHVRNSGEIGGFKIMSESSIGSGARRIEAITGSNLLKPLYRAERILGALGEILKAQPDMLRDRVEGLFTELRDTKRELEAVKNEKAGGAAAEMLAKAERIGEGEKLIKLVKGVFDDLETDELRGLADRLKGEEKGIAIVLASTAGNKLTFIVSVTDDLISRGLHAGKLVKDIAAAADGGGGGKADMAQAGAKDVSKLPAAWKTAEDQVKAFVEGGR